MAQTIVGRLLHADSFTKKSYTLIEPKTDNNQRSQDSLLHDINITQSVTNIRSRIYYIHIHADGVVGQYILKTGWVLGLG
ncbi:hypothetical protein Hanom_Chr00s020912g01760041 [Helianthus anomalus]